MIKEEKKRRSRWIRFFERFFRARLVFLTSNSRGRFGNAIIIRLPSLIEYDLYYMGRMISSLCNTISLNHLACQPRVARSPIHVRTTFKEVGRQPSSPRFFFHLVRRVLKFSMFYLCRSLTMRETHTHTQTHRVVSYFKEGI